jgi:hypothetical protein
MWPRSSQATKYPSTWYAGLTLLKGQLWIKSCFAGVSHAICHHIDGGNEGRLGCCQRQHLNVFSTYRRIEAAYGQLNTLDPTCSEGYNPHLKCEKASSNTTKFRYVAGTKGLCYTARR